jgi:hypothetical protein
MYFFCLRNASVYFITGRIDPYVQLLLPAFQERTLRTQVSRKAVSGNGAESITVDEYLKVSNT